MAHGEPLTIQILVLIYENAMTSYWVLNVQSGNVTVDKSPPKYMNPYFSEIGEYVARDFVRRVAKMHSEFKSSNFAMFFVEGTLGNKIERFLENALGNF